MNTEKALKGAGDKSQIHYDSILALEALLDIKKSPSVKSAQSNMSKIASLPLLETLRREGETMATSIGMSTRPIGTKTPTTLRGKAENMQMSLPRTPIDVAKNCVIKPVAPSPTLATLNPGTTPIMSPKYQVSATSKNFSRKRNLLNHNDGKQHVVNNSFPVQRLKKSFMSGLTDSGSVGAQPVVPPPPKWITVQSHQQVSNNTHDIPEITGLVPNPLSVMPESVLSSGSGTRLPSGLNHKGAVSKVPIIRATEVEAALRSKPQRGRKRENLTVLERLELTRTRNREHAKSTRVRKKARYQELLDREKEYQSLLKEIELKERRKECVVDFMKLRTRLLSSASWPEELNFSRTKNDPSAFDSKQKQEIRKVSLNCDEIHKDITQSLYSPDEMRGTSVEDSIDKTQERSINIESCPLHQALNKILYDPAEFRVIFRTPLPNQRLNTNQKGLEKLRDFDDNLREQVKGRFGSQAISSVKFTIPESFLGDISFSSSTCYVKYNLSASILCTGKGVKNTDAACFTGLIRASFHPGSHKFTCMEMWSNMDCVHNQGMRASGLNPSYNVIYSYPSVVSLDVSNTDHNDCNSGSS